MFKKYLFLYPLALVFLGVSTLEAELIGIDAWYTGAAISIEKHRDIKFVHFPELKVFEKIDFDLGYGIKLNAGAMMDNWRMEIEGSYRCFDVDKAKYDCGGYCPDGDLSYWSAMVNGFYDIPLPFCQFMNCFSWYFGGGIGVTLQKLEVCSYSYLASLDHRAVLFAFQAMTGINMMITECSHVYLGYRFFGATISKTFRRYYNQSTISVAGGTNNVTVTPINCPNVHTRPEEIPYSNSVELGFRWYF